MSFRRSNLTRELGTAFAVLAIYVLTLLAPLHQAAGLQRDLAKLGYETIGGWSICAPIQNDQDDKSPTVVKCAAAGIGKNELVAIEPATIDLGTVRVGETIRYAEHVRADAPAVHAHIGQARAPPVAV